MAIDPAQLLGLHGRAEAASYTDRDVMLYALAVGLGRDPLDQAELHYVSERAGLRTLPTFGTILPTLRFLDDCGWDFPWVVHAEERLRLHRALPAAGALRLDSRVLGLTDRGPRHGTAITVEIRASREHDEEPVFTIQRTLIARRDGGIGGLRHDLPRPHPLPERRPDMRCSTNTRPDQALLYRLCGDRNPLHADPDAAAEAGFGRPILHGLATLGIACHAILKTICEYDHTLIRTFEARFSAPVIPGDTLETEIWQEANIVSFRLRAVERATLVLTHGRCELAV